MLLLSLLVQMDMIRLMLVIMQEHGLVILQPYAIIVNLVITPIITTVQIVGMIVQILSHKH
ncbi:hypothetical protein D3C78_1323870 [compost metagenome]